METSLKGQVAVVTGSTSGIGLAIARQFSEAGASVVLNSFRSAERGQELAAELPDAIYVQCDMGDPEAAATVLEPVMERWGRLDIVVNNAGATKFIQHRDLEAADLDLWRRVFEVNVFGYWMLSRAAVPLMGEHGCIINMSSLSGIRTSGSSVPYAVSKAAINHMTRLLASALGPKIRVNAIAPGLVDTPWNEGTEKIRESVLSRMPMQRAGTADEVAQVAMLLATNEYMTGEVIVVDGGLQHR